MIGPELLNTVQKQTKDNTEDLTNKISSFDHIIRRKNKTKN